MTEVQRKFEIMKRRVWALRLHCKGDRLATDLLKAFEDKDPSMTLVSGNEKEILRKSSDFAGLGKPPHEFPSWSSYAGCYTVVLEENGQVTVGVWDGDSLDGEPVRLRYKAVFEMPWWRTPSICTAVNLAWDDHVKQEWERREELKRQAEYARISSELTAASLVPEKC